MQLIIKSHIVKVRIKMKNNIHILISLMVFVFIPFTCKATCDIDTKQEDVAQFGNVIVQRDSPVGTVLATKRKDFSLHAGGIGGCAFYYTMFYNSAVASGQEHVYKTNISGVGIKATFGDYAGWHTADVPATKGRQFEGGTWMTGWIIDLIKTGDIESGILSSGKIAAGKFSLSADGAPGNEVSVNLVSSSITQVMCSTKNGNSLSFPIGNVSASEFLGKGTISAEKNTVNITLSCDPHANINITLNGIQNADSSDGSVLALSNQGQTGVAEGVGVQLLYDNQPIQINQLLPLKQSQGGQESFPLTARYIQTKDAVKPGSANATATLNLTYQ